MKKVVIVGVGALGSHVALLLRNEAELTVIDCDKVEQKNVLAQFHPKSSVRQNKAESIKKTMQFLYGTSIKSIPHKLTPDNAKELLLGDLIIDCLDNGEGRRAIVNFIRTRDAWQLQLEKTNSRQPIADRGVGSTLLHGALAPNGEFGRAIWDEQFKIDDEAGAGAATCEGGEFLPFITITASYLAYSAQTFLRTGKKIGFQIYPGGATRV